MSIPDKCPDCGAEMAGPEQIEADERRVYYAKCGREWYVTGWCLPTRTCLASQRDQWKARAEKAEAEVGRLRKATND